MSVPRLSFVVPAYNEAESLPTLAEQIAKSAGALGAGYEVVFVDDGSTDDSWAVIQSLAEARPEIRAIRFRTNFGKAAALEAGFRAAAGEVVFTLDADLQDDPAEVPRFLERLEMGLDVVSGWKRVRHDPWHKVLPSRVFNGLVSRVTGVKLHDHNCGFKAYRSEVLAELRLYGELHRFVPVLANVRGFKVGELVVHHRPRQFGRSKFGWQRFVKGFLDLMSVRFVTRFGTRPGHPLGAMALLCGGTGALAALAAPVLWWLGLALGFWLGLAASVVGLVAGCQFLAAALLAELLVAQRRPEQVGYSVRETIR